MKQILQDLKSGRTVVETLPVPIVRSGSLRIRATRSLVSAGTERMLVEFARAGLLDKARQQPEKVRDAIDKVRTEGLLSTIDAIRSKLDQPLALGYSHVGVVDAIGAGVDGFAPGDRVVSNSSHAEVAVAPVNLCARIPDGVSDDQAAFVVVASIGLQGVRLAAPTLGECFVVVGLGLIGLLTVQLLRAQGCRVLGIDISSQRAALAREFGAEIVDLSRGDDALAAASAFSRGHGVDGVIITASTSDSGPVSQAAKMCRKRGRIVLVGVTGLELSRQDFYEKELSFQVSCSYGPGRYDPNYEQKGVDYPIGFVRWTEQRNFEAVLDLLASGALDVAPLITHRFHLERAEDAYTALSSERGAMGILIEYGGAGDSAPPVDERRVRIGTLREPLAGGAVLGFIGAGNYAGRILIPAFAKAGATLHSVVTSSGVNAVHFGRKYDFTYSGTDAAAIMAEPAINTVVVATRHDSHARFVSEALSHGHHVFVEKPLALTLPQVDMVEAALARQAGGARPAPCLMVGFNRRFAPHVQKMKSMLSSLRSPKAIVITVNAGYIPANHWTQDPAVGGGRLIGEACHMIDLARFLAGVPASGFHALALGDATTSTPSDSAQLSIAFEDGSIASIQYLSGGHKAFPKERVEVFAGGRVLQLDNFRVLRGFGWPGFRTMRSLRQDKGQAACAKAFIDAIATGGPSPIPAEELFEVSRMAIEMAEQVRQR